MSNIFLFFFRAGRENRTPRSTEWKSGARPLRLSTRIIVLALRDGSNPIR